MNTTTPPAARHNLVAHIEILDRAPIDQLREELADIPDHRHRRGIRHQLADILICVLLAKTAGATSIAAIARWMEDNQPRLAGVGLKPCSYDTVRRVATGIDVDTLDAAACAVAARRLRPAPGPAPGGGAGRHVVAVDGKELTGSIGRDRRPTRLVAAMDQHAGVVLAQGQVAAKGGEQGALPALLSRIDRPGGFVVTGDAGFNGAPSRKAITQAGGSWVLAVKGNQSNALTALETSDWDDRPVGFHAKESGHGRKSEVWVKRIAYPDPKAAPITGATCAIQVRRVTERPNSDSAKNGKHRPKTKPKQSSRIERTTRRGKTYNTAEELVYILTSIPDGQVDCEELYKLNREHWLIENKLHAVRDMTLSEDASQIRTGNAPRFMAIFNNLLISLIRVKEGINANIKAATRKAASNLSYTLCLLALPKLE
ncbi:MAG: transposase family protein [Bifidobacteriaceae bacterium]|jgi:predicted transposase YbfD/YdcC|nr:transposase family protein [Bifidobacteriaceae bacterium]